MMKTIHVILSIIAFPAMLMMVLTGCDEQLPARMDPSIALRGTIDAIYFGPADPGYGAVDNKLPIYLDIQYPRASFDETIQGEAEMSATIEIVWQGHRRDITLDKKSVIENRRHKYDAATNILTLDPGDMVSFFYDWDFRDNNGVFLPDIWARGIDSSCPKQETIVTPDSVFIITTYPITLAYGIVEVSGSAKLWQPFAVCRAPMRQFPVRWQNMPCRFLRSDP